MNLTGRIESNAQVLCGKPVLKGTRLSVEHIVGLLGQGWSEADVLRSYPGLTHEDVLACLQYAAESLAMEELVLMDSHAGT